MIEIKIFNKILIVFIMFKIKIIRIIQIIVVILTHEYKIIFNI